MILDLNKLDKNEKGCWLSGHRRRRLRLVSISIDVRSWAGKCWTRWTLSDDPHPEDGVPVVLDESHHCGCHKSWISSETWWSHWAGHAPSPLFLEPRANMTTDPHGRPVMVGQGGHMHQDGASFRTSWPQADVQVPLLVTVSLAFRPPRRDWRVPWHDPGPPVAVCPALTLRAPIRHLRWWPEAPLPPPKPGWGSARRVRQHQVVPARLGIGIR